MPAAVAATSIADAHASTSRRISSRDYCIMLCQPLTPSSFVDQPYAAFASLQDQQDGVREQENVLDDNSECIGRQNDSPRDSSRGTRLGKGSTDFAA